jgi:Glyoxalase-like domain
MNTSQQEATTTISLTLDCADPERLANFWNQALGYQQVAAVDNFVVLAPLRLLPA